MVLLTAAVLVLTAFFAGSARAGYVDNKNGTVTDSFTGLTWQKGDGQNASGGRTWRQALSYCEKLTLGGKSDWRLPNVRELQSLVDYDSCCPAIDTDFFPDCLSDWYWSSSTDAGYPGGAWYVDFDDGFVGNYDKSFSYYVRCVRGGPRPFGSLTIAQTPMSGPPGTTFVQWGTGFTPNGNATLHFRKPDGTEYGTQTIKLDAGGHFELSYTSEWNKPVGTYTWWVIDDTSGRKSNEVSYVIERTSSYFSFSKIASPQTVGQPFSFTLTARRLDGTRDTGFSGEVDLSSTVGQLNNCRVTLSGGQATVSRVTLDSGGLQVSLVASIPGRIGTSKPFTVQGGARDAFITGVVQGVDGAVAADATVHLMRDYREIAVRGTDASGRYWFQGLNAGAYDVIAKAPDGRCSRTHSAVVSDHTCLPLDLTVRWTGNKANPAGLTPILLVPGILGSSMGFGGPYPTLPRDAPAWNAQWPGESRGLHDPFGVVGWRDLMKALEAEGYKLEETLFPVPYDWRLDIDRAAKDYLKPWIDEAKRRAGTGKVHIIAHSMGGLVTRAYIQGGKYGKDIDRFAMVGTPNHGAGLAYYLWQGGDPIMAEHVRLRLAGGPVSKLKSYFLRLYQDTMEYEHQTHFFFPVKPLNRDVGDLAYRQRMHHLAHKHVDSLEQLMPTYSFLIDNGKLSCDKNQWLIDLNKDDDRYRMGSETAGDGKVRTKIFVGKGIDTLTNIRVTDKWCESPLFYPDGTPLSAFLTQSSSSGDGTVLVSSASLDWLPDPIWTNEEHGSLIKAFANRLVGFVSESGLSEVQEMAAREAEEPSSVFSVAVDGRAKPYLVDPAGRAVGIDPTTGKPAEGIPGAKLLMGGSGLTISLENPEAGAYTLKLLDGYEEDYRLVISYLDSEKTVVREFTPFSNKEVTTLTAHVQPSLETRLKVETQAPIPQNVKALPVNSGGLKTKVCWQKSSNPDVASYRVYSKLENEPHLKRIAGGIKGACFETSHPWASRKSIPTRFYTVSAVMSNGDEGFLSDMIRNDDRDRDGLSDPDEASYGTRVNNADSDGDGLSDGEEVAHRTNPLVKDTDGDDYDDGVEVEAGSDPLDKGSVPTPLSAGFTASPTSGSSPLTVAFTNTSSGTIGSYRWDFGDGAESNGKNPTHVYRQPGTYTVKLTVSGVGGSKTMTRTGYIQVN
jgi:pimeloyl-ACP methyl ester carboxylesterase